MLRLHRMPHKRVRCDTPPASSREQSVKKKQGQYKTRRQKANSLTFIKGFRFDFKPNTSLYSFLPRSFPSRQTDAQTDTVYLLPSQTCILLACVLSTNLKKKKKTASSNSIAHYSSLQKRKAPRAISYLLLTKVSETISSGC